MFNVDEEFSFSTRKRIRSKIVQLEAMLKQRGESTDCTFKSCKYKKINIVPMILHLNNRYLEMDLFFTLTLF